MLPAHPVMSREPIFVAVLALCASPAHAEETAWDAHPVAVYGQLSLPGGPTGLLGAQVEVSPVARFGTSLAAGVGLNRDIDGWRAVPRYAAAVGYRPWMAQKGKEGGAAGFWLSGSTGPYYEPEFTIEAGVADQAYEIPRAYWLGVAFVGERRFGSGLSVKGSVGLEYLVNSSDARCYEREHSSGARRRIPCDDVSRLTLSPIFPAATLAVGYAF